MAVDIAELGLRVRSDGVITASKRLRDLGKAANQAETAAERLERQADKVAKSMKGMGREAQKTGRNMSLFITAPLLALGVASVKTFSDFESSFTNVRKTVDATEEQFAELSDELRELAKTVPTTVNELNVLAGVAGQLGVQRENLVEFTRVIAMLGDTTDIAGEQAALSLSRFMNVMGTAQGDIDRVGSTIVGLGNKFAAMESEIVFTATSLAAFGSAMGLTEAQVLAFATAIAASGGKTEAASTAFQKTASIMQQAVIEINEDLLVFADVAGVSADEFARAFREDAAGAIQLFLRGLKRIRDEGLSTASVLDKLGLADQRLQREFGKLLGNLDQLDSALVQSGDEWERNTALVEEAEKRYETFASQLKITKNQINDVSIELGAVFAPAVLEMVRNIRDMAVAFKELDKPMQNLIIGIGLFVAIVGPLLIVFGSLVRAIGLLWPLFIKLAMAIGGPLTIQLFAFRALLISLGVHLGAVGAIAIGLGIIIKLIGDEYVRALERAIIVTGDFKAAINDVSMVTLAANLKSVAGEVDRLLLAREMQVSKIAGIQAMLADADVMGQPGQAALLNAELERANLALDEANHFLDQAIRLRDSYTGRIRETVLALEAEKVAIDAVNDAETSAPPPVLSSDEADDLQDLKDLIDPTAEAMADLKAAYALLKKALNTGDLNPEQYKELIDLLHRSELAADAFADAIGEMKDLDVTIMADLEKSFEFIEGLELMEQQVRSLQEAFDPTGAAVRDLVEAYKELGELQQAGAFDDNPELFFELSEAIDKASTSVMLLDDTFQRGAQEWLTTLEGMQGLFHEDSRAAELLRTAMIALNIVMGINAVIKQLGSADPYTAIPRALAVAGLIASMGVNTGASGGSSSSRSLQESQGTGSVLGDAEAKSESLLKASEITADATSELVGINRGMLHALQNLQSGLGGAAVQLARGADDTDFGALPKGLDFSAVLGKFDIFGLDFIGGILNKLLGGKSKLMDQGIHIVGGFLDDLTTEVMVQAFQTIKVKKSIFHSSKIKQEFQDLGDEVSTQFALVFESIRDTVMEGALALGVPIDIIEERIAAFQVATQDISLKDLTGDEVQEELIAVFSEIFDDLALQVVPFIGDFQKVGEGLGETLVRVATSVQVFQEAVTALGLSVDAVDAEAFAHIAVGLVEMVGGVQNFISLFATFFDKFASDEQKLLFVTDQLTRAFADVGLELPKTRDGMWDLMSSLDATTESGQRQIAMLLEIAGVADEYYSLMEDGTGDMVAKARELVAVIGEFVGIGDSGQLKTLKNNFNAAMEAAKGLNATQLEYAAITRAFDLQLKRMAASLRISVLSMTQTLFGSGPGGASAPNPVVDGLEETREVANSVFTEWQRALESIFEFTQSLLLDENLTTLTPAERLTEAQQQFNETLAAAQAGDVDAAAALPDAAQALLEEARFMFASGQQYTDIFDSTLAALDSIAIPSDIPEFITEVVDSGGGSPGGELTETDKMIAALERYLLAVDLATALRDLAHVMDVSVIALAKELGVPLRELAVILGVNLDPVDDTTAAAIGEMAQLLGANVFELMDAIGVSLEDLAVATGVHVDNLSQELAKQLGSFALTLGVDVFELADQLDVSIADLAKTFGVGIDAFSAEQFKALVEFSRALGVGVSDVAHALDINLGSIADATSLISEAFDIAIAELPRAIQADLGPLLFAIREATTAADANVAVNNLGTYVLGLPPDIAAALLPFLDAIGFEQLAPELAALFGIEQNTRDTVNAILGLELGGTGDGGGFGSNLDPTAPVFGPPAPTTDFSFGAGVNNNKTIDGTGYKKGFATGGSVDQTGLHQLHAGEFVVNASHNNISPAPDNNLSNQELREIRTVLGDIRDQQRRYQEADLESTRGIESSMKQQAEQTRRVANG